MMSARRLAQLAKKWQRMAMGRKRLTSTSSLSTTPARETEGPCGTSTSTVVAGKGHYAVYTVDGARFEVPLAVFGELLRMSQEEFGFAGGDGAGKITLPCDAAVMEYAMCLLRRSVSVEVEMAFLGSMAMVPWPCRYDAAPRLGFNKTSKFLSAANS